MVRVWFPARNHTLTWLSFPCQCDSGRCFALVAVDDFHITLGGSDAFVCHVTLNGTDVGTGCGLQSSVCSAVWVESNVLGDSCRTDPFLHRLLCPAPFQTFEHDSFFPWAIPDQFQGFIAYRDDVLSLGLLRDGMYTFPSGSKINDFLPAKGEYIAESQTGQALKEGSGF